VFRVALCLYAADNARAQSLDWVKQDGGQGIDNAEAIAVDSLGNSYVTGTFRIETTFGAGESNETVLTGTGGQSIFIAKYGPNGLLVWARGAGGAPFVQDWAFGIALDSAGNSYVTGFLTGGFADFGGGVTLNSPGAFIVKHDSEGRAEWATTLNPNAVAWAIAVDANGNSFVGGSAPPSPALAPQVTVWKVGATGTTLWTRSATGVYSGAAYGISVDGNGNSSVTGEVQGGIATFGPGEANETSLGNAAGGVMFVAKYDTSGNLIWARHSTEATQFGASPRGNAISTDAAGSSYLVGMGSTILGPGEPNETAVATAFVAKYDSLGNLVWARTVSPGFGTVSWVFAIAHDSAGPTYITGTSIQGNVFIEKYSIDGDLLWARKLATVASTDVLSLQGSGISLDSGGNAYVAGYFSSAVTFGPGEPGEKLLTTTILFDVDVFLAKYLTDGPVRNVAPVATDQSVTTPEDTPLTIVLSATDADNDPLIYSVVDPPQHGTLMGTAPALTYTPASNYFGPDDFTFRVSDGIDVSNVAPVIITVSPVNDPPIAHSQTVSTPENIPVTITLTATDVESDLLTYHVVDQPTHGALDVVAMPTVTYTPQLGYAGADSFTFRAFDGTDSSAPPALVTLSVELASLPCGAFVSGSIGAIGEVDTYRFVGQAGRIITLAVASAGGFTTGQSVSSSALLTLLAPDGAVVGRLRSNSQGNFTLPATGTYMVRVNASNLRNTGSYNVSLHCLFPSTPGTPVLQCGALQAGTITAPGKVDLYAFAGQAGQIISLALASTGGFSTGQNISSSALLTLFAPGGVSLGSLRSNSQVNFTLAATGTYVLRVSASNLGNTGSYNVSLHCLVPATPGTPLLQCGALQAGTITAPGDVDLYAFAGQAGQIISLALGNTGGFSTGQNISSSALLTLFAPGGASMGSLRSNSQVSFTLPATGTYVVRVSASNLGNTGSYNVSFHCLLPPTPGTPMLQCGALQTGTITAPGDVDLYSFVSAFGHTVTLTLASTGGFSTRRNITSSALLTFFAPDGSLLGSLRSDSQANFTLPATGTYVVRVNASNLGNTGSFNVGLICPS